MAYTPTTWTTGDTVTAALLNKMEQGIVDEGSAFVETTFDIGTGKTTCNKTAREIATLFANGKCVILGNIYDEQDDAEIFIYPVLYFSFEDVSGDFYFTMYTLNSSGTIISWTADSASGYVYTTSQT